MYIRTWPLLKPTTTHNHSGEPCDDCLYDTSGRQYVQVISSLSSHQYQLTDEPNYTFYVGNNLPRVLTNHTFPEYTKLPIVLIIITYCGKDARCFLVHRKIIVKRREMATTHLLIQPACRFWLSPASHSLALWTLHILLANRLSQSLTSAHPDLRRHHPIPKQSHPSLRLHMENGKMSVN